MEPVEIYVDGGIKRGRDIFKALALGAKAVLLGRPMIYGMAVGGELGVQRTVELLRDELKTVMQLAGCQSVSQIDRSFIVRHGTDTSSAEWAPDAAPAPDATAADSSAEPTEAEPAADITPSEPAAADASTGTQDLGTAALATEI